MKSGIYKIITDSLLFVLDCKVINDRLYGFVRIYNSDNHYIETQHYKGVKLKNFYNEPLYIEMLGIYILVNETHLQESRLK